MNVQMRKFWWAAVLAVGILGCDSKAQTEDAPADKASPTTAAAPSEVPDNLKSDAYHYYGMSNSKPMGISISVKAPGVERTLTGEQTIKFVGMEGGKAKFTVSRTGDAAEMGGEELLLGPSGITAASTSLGKVEGTPIELPAELKPGTTWKNDYKVTVDQGPAAGQVSEEHSTFKVVGTESVKTKAGTFDALKVESTGNNVRNGKKEKATTQTWWVKDRGAVKIVMTSVDESKATSTISIEATS